MGQGEVGIALAELPVGLADLLAAGVGLVGPGVGFELSGEVADDVGVEEVAGGGGVGL